MGKKTDNRSSAIRTLMDLRSIACQRNDVVELASRGEDWSEWASASRVWSRQAEALLLAVIGEPPTDLADVLSVLSCLAEMRDLFGSGDEQTNERERDVTEMTDTAIHNCIKALAAIVVPQDEYPKIEIASIDWTVKQVARWLPSPANAEDLA